MMLLDGYDHIIDVCDNDGFAIAQVAKSRGHHELAKFLNDLTEFEVNKVINFQSFLIIFTRVTNNKK